MLCGNGSQEFEFLVARKMGQKGTSMPIVARLSSVLSLLKEYLRVVHAASYLSRSAKQFRALSLPCG